MKKIILVVMLIGWSGLCFGAPESVKVSKEVWEYLNKTIISVELESGIDDSITFNLPLSESVSPWLLLGIDDVSKQSISKAHKNYQKLRVEFHPDKNNIHKRHPQALASDLFNIIKAANDEIAKQDTPINPQPKKNFVTAWFEKRSAGDKIIMAIMGLIGLHLIVELIERFKKPKQQQNSQFQDTQS